jgi:tetratricopeptide (TPR) repeat protein
MRIWISILIPLFIVTLTAATLRATGPDARELAQKGYSTFKEVLAGDEAKLPDAIHYMEEARSGDETYVPNLYNLARAYFFEAITFNKDESAAKAEKTFARLLELAPTRFDAMSFHAAILIQQSGGRDMAKFMQGAQELRKASQGDPNDLTVRIVTAFVSPNLPPQAQQLIGMTDPVGNLNFIGGAFDQFSSDFAPHASVVMNAFIGEALLASGNKEKARQSFQKALKVAQPADEGQVAGRKVLDSVIAARMNGGEKSVFADPVFSGCHACHLSAPDKLLPR